MSHAIILRCAPAKTRELLTWGIETYPGLLWAPLITRYGRLPRSRKRVKVTRAALPGYLFMSEALQPIRQPIEELGRKDCRPLWINGYFARCSMEELQQLRTTISGIEADMLTPAALPTYPRFPVGSIVKVVATDHVLADLEGVVISQKEDLVTIESQGFWSTLQISSFLLQQAGL